ncbi:MAG: ribosomal L7Ae/L30e/S12e/Gadd45 family protein [Clostridia bacterium]|nr:ribosomal L7Ae/L30e/S12e/Gadd45 family protein [Clostridia bacterium]
MKSEGVNVFLDGQPRSTPKNSAIVAGFNQFKKLVRSNRAKVVYLALDADPSLIKEVCDLCASAKIPPDRGHTKAELGKLCDLEVGCGVCVVPKE